MYSYETEEVCSGSILFDLEDGTVRNVRFIGGCPGNLQGISKLVEGMPAQDVIDRLEGILCARKSTSCPDQLAKALRLAMEQ